MVYYQCCVLIGWATSINKSDEWNKSAKILTNVQTFRDCALHQWMFVMSCATIPGIRNDTNPFSNESGAVLLRFQKDLRPHLSFSDRFSPSTLQRRICLKTLLYPQCAWSNELDACAFQYIGPRNWSYMVAPVRHFGYSRSSGFDDVTVFR